MTNPIMQFGIKKKLGKQLYSKSAYIYMLSFMYICSHKCKHENKKL